MEQFKVGELYWSPSERSYIRVTRRTESTVWFSCVENDGREWTSDFFNRKRVQVDDYYGCERIWDASLGRCFYAINHVSKDEFAARVAQRKAKFEAVEQKKQQQFEKQVNELRKWLAASCLSMKTVDAVLEKFSGVSENVLEVLRRGN